MSAQEIIEAGREHAEQMTDAGRVLYAYGLLNPDRSHTGPSIASLVGTLGGDDYHDDAGRRGDPSSVYVMPDGSVIVDHNAGTDCYADVSDYQDVVGTPATGTADHYALVAVGRI